MQLDFILIYSLTVFVASIIPGPSMLLALTHGIQHGAKKTIASAMGNLSATIIQAAISFAGLGTILIASETLFLAIKWAGAAYLVYMGISILLSAKMNIALKESDNLSKTVPMRKMYFQAFWVTAGNPKAIIFFTSVFPQFIDHNAPYFMQICILMSIIIVIAFSCFMIYAIAGQKIISLFSRAKAGRYIKGVIGSTFIGAGIGLAVSDG